MIRFVRINTENTRGVLLTIHSHICANTLDTGKRFLDCDLLCLKLTYSIVNVFIVLIYIVPIVSNISYISYR